MSKNLPPGVTASMIDHHCDGDPEQIYRDSLNLASQTITLLKRIGSGRGRVSKADVLKLLEDVEFNVETAKMIVNRA